MEACSVRGAAWDVLGGPGMLQLQFKPKSRRGTSVSDPICQIAEAEPFSTEILTVGTESRLDSLP